MKVDQLKKERQREVLAWKKIAGDPELEIVLKTFRRIYDVALVPTEKVPLERLVGRRDVARDILQMVMTETNDD